MKQISMRSFQAHRNTGLVCLGLIAGLPLFAQPAADSYLSHVQVQTSTTPQQAAEVVTIQELSHSVPSRARREMEKGLQAFARHINQEALVHLLRAVEKDPEYVAARNNLAAVYMSMGNPDAAVGQLKAAVQIDSNRALLFNNLAVGYWMLNRYSDAEGVARTAVRLAPSLDSARAILGIALFQQRQYTDEALRYLSGAGADYPYIRLLCARILVAQGHSDVARTEIQKYLSSGDTKNRSVAERWLEAIDHPNPEQRLFPDR
jgi:tetratricopeptide (TPR) repeat protein